MTRQKPATIIIPINDVSGACREPTLEEILSDTIVQAVMRADAVEPEELRALLGKIARMRRLAA